MNSKKQVLLICLIGAVIGMSLLIQHRVHRDISAQMYTDPQYRFRIACPDSGWTLSDTTGFSNVLLIVKSNAIVDGFIPNVTVAIEFLPHMLNALEYAQKNQDFLVAKGFEISSMNKAVINQNILCDLQCVNSHLSPPLRFRYLCLVKDQIGFTITCTAPEKHYLEFARDFEYIVKTFRFI